MADAAIRVEAKEELEKSVDSPGVLTASLPGQCLAELVGTFIVILCGNGSVSVAVMTGALTGSSALDGWAVAMMWGLGVTFGIYVAGPVSGAHFNPAVTIAMTAFRGFPARKIPAYVASQVAGAYAACALIYGLWHGFWPQAAEKLGVQIGQPGSQRMAAIFACFYPSPGLGTDAQAWAQLTTPTAFMIEVLLTAFLLMMVFALTEPDNPGLPQAGLGPLFIGLTVTATIGIGGALTMDAINPVRDFGPRLFAYTIGFGEIAFPGPRGNEWWLYILAPIVGGIVGAAAYRYLVRRFLPRPAQS
ncbi:MAG TPA: MIP/aquaporin family protein [Blastocatellia bacterium]|nr:MIP/aquaporin family protein [Blastocatellia bacterium]